MARPLPTQFAPLTKPAVREVFEGTFGRAGLRAKVAAVSRSSEGVVARGRILTPEGRKVGEFTRSFELDAGGDLVVWHSSMATSVQHTGFATEFNRHAYEGYRQLGVKRVSVQAEHDGAVAWALDQGGGRGFELDEAGASIARRARTRAGFIWDQVHEAHRAGRLNDAEFGALLPRLHDPAAPRSIRPNDIRDLTSLRASGADNVRNVMAGSSWEGTMTL